MHVFLYCMFLNWFYNIINRYHIIPYNPKISAFLKLIFILWFKKLKPPFYPRKIKFFFLKYVHPRNFPLGFRVLLSSKKVDRKLNLKISFVFLYFFWRSIKNIFSLRR